MASKLQMYAQMADYTAMQLTGSYQQWTAFLTTAARLYKYPYHEQLLIFAQRPQATACASYDFWNDRMGRYVRRGTRGIALLDSSGDNPRLKYVFDVADTGRTERSRRVVLWEYREEYRAVVSDMLARRYGVENENHIETLFEQVAAQLADLYWNDHREDILGIVDDSFLYGYDDFNVGAAFRNAATVSITYSLMSRCGLNSDEYFTHEDFLAIFDWNTPAAVAELGTAISTINQEVLRQIEITIKQYEREKIAERSVTNERTDLHAERGLSDSRPDPDGAGADAPRQVRANEEATPAKEQTGPVQSAAAVGEAVPAPAGDRQRGEQPSGADDAGAGESSGRDGGTESSRSDEVGGADGELQGAGRGSDFERAGVQLTLPDTPVTGDQLTMFPSEAEQIQRITEAESVPVTPFAFSVSDADLDHILRLGSNTDEHRMRVVTEFSKGKTNEELAAYLQKNYHGGNGFTMDSGRLSAWYAEDGIHIAKGDAARTVSSAQVVSWADAAEHIRTMLENGTFATNVELAEAPGYERTRIALKLLYLYHDLSEQARSTGLLSVMDALRGGGYPDEQDRLAAFLENAENRAALRSSYDAFLTAYQEDKTVLRFRYHRPQELQIRLQELDLPRMEYHSDMAEIPSVPQFITEDEIAHTLAHGSGMEDGKLRIHAYFQEAHTLKEQIDFLKKEYGIGGRSHAVSGATFSGEDHDGKGIKLKKQNCYDVQLSWNNVAKRIAAMEQENRYLTELEQEKYRAIHDAPTAYNSVKEQHPDDMILYQVGDFFELYGEDAKVAAKELDLYLTFRRLPDVGSVDMCGIPAKRLEECVEKLRDKHDVTISAVNEETHERHVYTMISIDYEAERAIDAYEAEFGADGYRAFPGNRPEEEAQEQPEQAESVVTAVEQQSEVPKPTLREQYEQYKPIIAAAISEDTAYRNACGHSDRENATIEGNAAISRAVLASGDMELIRLYSDFPNFRSRLHNEIIGETYPRLHELLRPLSQDDIDDALRAWNGDEDSKRRVVRYMETHARERDTAAWLSREYGGDEGKNLMIARAGSPEAMELPWPMVQRRIAQLMMAGNYIDAPQNIGVFLGERDNTLYFYAPVSYSLDTRFENAPKVRDDQRVVIAAPVCYQGAEYMQKHHITFLKIGRDIEEQQFHGRDFAAQLATMQQATTYRTPEGNTYRLGDIIEGRTADGGHFHFAVDSMDLDSMYYTFPDMPEQAPTEMLRGRFDAHLDDGLFTVVKQEPEQVMQEDPEQVFAQAKDLINHFCRSEYGNNADFSDLTKIGIAYTTVTDDEIPIQVNVDLVHYRLERYLEDEHLETRQYGSLKELIAKELESLDFSDLTYVSDEDVVQHRFYEPTAEGAAERPFLYAVGDTVYLDGKPFEITEVRDREVELRDPSLLYPIFRTESKDNLARLLREDARNSVYTAPAEEKPPAEAPAFTEETVAFYSGAENHLPYDVEIRTLHIPEPEKTVEEVLDEHPASIQVNGEWQTFPNARAAEQASLQEYKDNLRRNAENFRITDDELGIGGPKAKFRMNMDAIKLLKELESHGMQALPEQQEVLSRYVGWGGLPDAFDESKANWADEFQELKEALTPEEYAAARASTLNAHYTSPTVIKAIYEAVGNMGFQSGNILEPSMGVGNFFGLLPDNMAGSKLYGVELDSISGRIAKQLYPHADITVAGFETTDRRDFFDLAIGNVPFGQYQVNDRAYNKLGFSIHNYFFSKALDQVRPGGVVAFVTSRYTMDAKDPAARKYIAERAELLGAIRLPNNAFKANAGTDVVSDIIFLQKRDRPIAIEPDWVHLGVNADGFAINSYFIDHPEMILGRQTSESTQYGKQDFTVEPYENLDLDVQLKYAIQNIKGTFVEAELPDLGEDEEIRDTIPADPNVKNYSYTIVDGEIYYRENSVMVRPELNATAKERVRGMVELRDCMQKLIGQQMDGFISDAAIRSTQAELNTRYDSFTAKYGLINDRANRLAFADDSSYYLLCSLEELDENRNLKRKADMFTKRTIRPHEAVTSVDTAAEALALSIGEHGMVDMDYMCQLTGKSEQQIFNDLKGAIFLNPLYGYSDANEKRYVTADEYLSGDVREKLRIAESSAALYSGDYAPNVEALRKVQPKDLDASEIDVRLGATWLDVDYIQQFMEETFNTPFYLRRNIQVQYAPYTSEWSITGKKTVAYNNIEAYMTYGTERANGYKILEDTLNLRDVRIYDTKVDADGKERRVLNSKETTLAQQKQQAIKDAFRDWIWRDPDRRQAIVQQYNELFNSVRPREYDGQHIIFSGMNPEITLREHQRNAVAHILYGGNTLLAHEVGGGKTFEMVAAAMESKRLGLCTKSLFAVPNHLTEQWASEFLRLYPSANILVATKKDFEPHNRKKFCARIATGEYDAVIIGHSQFEKIPVSLERQERLLQEQIDEITDGIQELKNSHAERFTIKQMEKTKRSLEARLQKLHDSSRKDDVVTFEQLGIDRLYVDEAHSYKNVFIYTKMRNVAGLSTTDAQKSSDMLMKCRYLDEITDGKGVIFATGTPVSNSMTELFTMMRYLQHDMLKRKNLTHFDCWASTFGETTTAIELAPEGTGYRARTRFARFHNLPELMCLFKEAADIKTADQLNLPTPTPIYHNEVAQPTEIQQGMVQELSKRAAAVHAGLVNASQDNMLKITSDGRKLGLDQRIINPDLPDDPNSKVNLCVRNIVKIWQDGQADRLTQLVFCDLSTPKALAKGMDKGGNKTADSAELHALVSAVDQTVHEEAPPFTVYEDIRSKLIASGIPAEEIAFIHDANTEVKKKDLFAKVRTGQVRVLMGSTFKMGAGMNVQDRLIALHDLDAPWRPGDLEQRSGRIIRQGNLNPEVHIYRYVTEATFDAYLWQTLENKQKFISQIMTSKSPVRSCEDVDETALSYAEIKALCAGDDRIREKMDLDVDVARLKLMRSNHQSQQFRLEDQLLKTFPKQIEQDKEFIAGFEQDIQTVKAHPHPTDGFAGMTIRSDTLTDKENAGAALLDTFQDVKSLEPIPVGHYRGFDMSLSLEDFGKQYILTLKGAMSHRVELGKDARGNLTRIDNALNNIEARMKGVQAHLENLYAQVESAKAELGKPFPQEAEYQEKSARLAELNIALNIDDKTPMEVLAENNDALAKQPRQSILSKLKAPLPPAAAPEKKEEREGR